MEHRRRLHHLAAHFSGSTPASPAPATPACSSSSSSTEVALPEFSLAEVARHNSRESCWVAIRGEVFDFTRFIDAHPGGARGLLRYAGTDASEVFAELHSQSIFGAFGPEYRIGALVGPGRGEQAEWPGVSPISRGWEGLPGALSDVANTCPAVPSPFPHDAYTGSGCETFRFLWTIADR